MHYTALITGASGGLGEQFAHLCAAEKMDLVLVARSKDTLETLAKELKDAHSVKVLVIAADLSDPQSIDDIVHTIDRQNIAVTTLINNAGFGSYGLFVHGDMHDQQQMLQVNIAALTALTRQLLPGMIERKHGRILNIASTAAFQPGPLMAMYYATKAYVMNFSVALSNETQGTGVTVTCLCPGPTKTGFSRNAHMAKTRLFSLGLMDANTVARIGLIALKQGKPLVIAGVRNRIGVFLTRLVPRTAAAAVARRVQSPIS